MANDSLVEAISALFAQGADDHSAVAAQVFCLVDGPSALLELSRDAFERPGTFIPRAYLHSNGFLKLEFARFGASQLRLRAHFWNRAWGLDVQNPHDHAFDFSSKVVLGEFSHKVFERAPTGHPYHWFRYRREMRESVDAYQLQYSGIANLRLAQDRTIRASEWYTFSERAIHTFEPTTEKAATLLVSRPDLNNSWSDIFSTRLELRDDERNARLLRSDEVLSRVESVVT